MSHLAPNYAPLPVVLASGEGSWVTDVTGRRYFDALAGYSALNFGHRHPALIQAARRQLERITLASRAFESDLLEPFADALAALSRTEMVLPMNTGAEAVETAIKTARRWGHEVRGLPEDAGTILVADQNFHGRTTTIVSFSSDPDARRGFGPFTPGFRAVPYGDAEALAAAMGPDVVAVLLEPIQGEAGVIVPPADYLPAVRRACDEAGALLVLDEIQSGLGRTGTTFAHDLVGVDPDLMTLGKALGGGVVPISAVVGRADVLEVMTAGTHGSTFGGNPLACALGLAVIELLGTGEFQRMARTNGAMMHERLEAMAAEGLVDAVRGVGLWAGIDVFPERATGRRVCELLAEQGVLVKETHGSTIRLAPPLNSDPADLTWALDRLEAVLKDLAAGRPAPAADTGGDTVTADPGSAPAAPAADGAPVPASLPDPV